MLLAVVVFGLCSCEDDKDPVLQKPTEFVLNQPATSELYYALNPTATLNLTFSQPNYGPGIIAKYFVQVSLTREFTDFVQLSEEYTTCSVNVPESSIAEAMCKLRGVTNEDNYTDEPARPVYFRVLSTVEEYLGGKEDAAGYSILSNVVCLSQVKDYYAVKLPGKIYLVGDCSGWNEPSKANADKYPTLAQPDPSYHGAVFADVAGRCQRLTTLSTAKSTQACSIFLQANSNSASIALSLVGMLIQSVRRLMTILLISSGLTALATTALSWKARARSSTAAGLAAR